MDFKILFERIVMLSNRQAKTSGPQRAWNFLNG